MEISDFNASFVDFYGATSYVNYMLEKRFWAKVNKKSSNECWEWTASGTTKGYGKIGCEKGSSKRMELAHRVSFELKFGAIPKGMLVLHKCDNRGCVNPKHLFLGSHKDNMQDMIAKNRDKYVGAPKGEAHSLSKFTENEILDIRNRLASGETGKSIAMFYKVSRGAISNINTGRSWAWLVTPEK